MFEHEYQSALTHTREATRDSENHKVQAHDWPGYVVAYCFHFTLPHRC